MALWCAAFASGCGFEQEEPVELPRGDVFDVPVLSGRSDETGQAAQVMIRLAQAPSGTVFVRGQLSQDPSLPEQALLRQAELVFEPDTWDVPQVFEVEGLDDGVVDGTQAVTLTFEPVESSDPDFAAHEFAPLSIDVFDLDTTGACGGGAVGVSAGGEHACSVHADGTLRCWGNNRAGQLDTPTGSDFVQNDFGQTDAPSGPFIDLSVGSNHTCGLRSTGVIECWGANSDGQSDVPSLDADMESVHAGGSHTCGMLPTGNMVCWGSDMSGQSTVTSSSFVTFDAGIAHNCGVRDDSSIECWGLDQFDQISGVPTGAFSKVAVGAGHSCGVRSDDQSVVCWGLGLAGETDAPGGAFVDVSLGTAFSCAIDAQAGIECWGLNNHDQTIPPC